MFYESELSFFCKILNNMHIDTCLVNSKDSLPNSIDRGLRTFLNMEDSYKNLFSTLWRKVEPNTIYRLRDPFFCSYVFMLLPNTSTDTVLVAGPYLSTEITHQMLMEAVEKYAIPPQVFSQIEKYYGNLPVIKDDAQLIPIYNSFGEAIWGSMEKFSVKTTIQPVLEETSPDIMRTLANKADDPLLAIQMLEKRYEAERNLMQAVSQGMTHKAEQIFSNTSNLNLENRVNDPIRNIKNYMIIMNTLLRKAAEYGSVHPFYIDKVSSDFARKIEMLSSSDELASIQRDMIHKYCRLVKRHSMKKYSLLVQKVLTMIDSDLTADLSLSRQAELLNVNASYLSALFKKETGQTLTEYVTKKRVEHAGFLLKTTNLQIQTIAQHCGIYDVNYFTKMFKKYSGKTPKEYRGESVKY
ncbi:MAG: helix-turn-helix domain-containing protein [Clostridia bacterium]|nr:helix-turn-helix domain-containing protein [Clostridia bacterium]MBQ7046331.1 helix-turn-helix domain-containing protein [Oscillospiraceae bacterium]